MNFFIKTAKAVSISISNPIESQSLLQLAGEVGKFLYEIGAILGVIAMLWVAFLFMTAMGEEKRIEKARKALVWTLVGVFLTIISGGIVTTVVSFLTP